jgi:hypothetical protein
MLVCIGNAEPNHYFIKKSELALINAFGLEIRSCLKDQFVCSGNKRLSLKQGLINTPIVICYAALHVLPCIVETIKIDSDIAPWTSVYQIQYVSRQFPHYSPFQFMDWLRFSQFGSVQHTNWKSIVVLPPSSLINFRSAWSESRQLQ